MIVSWKHRYIFLHCRKTGGSSVTLSLARTIAPGDLRIGAFGDGPAWGVTPNRAAYLRLVRPRGALRFGYGLIRGADPWKAFNAAVTQSYIPRFGPNPGHAVASVVRRELPTEWQAFSKFCVVRNPYDRAVSDYRWRTSRLDSAPTFTRFLEEQPIDNWPFYTIDDKIVVDRVLRFESLQDDLRRTLSDIGVPWDGWLPTAKQFRKPSDYREMYSAHDKALVAKLFNREIETFGYSF